MHIDDGELRYAEFSPDGSMIVTTGADAILWDAVTGTKARSIGVTANSSVFTSASFSNDGTRIALSSGAMQTRIYEVSSGNELLALRDSNSSDVSFSPDGS